MIPARALLARLLAATTLVVPTACGEEAAPAPGQTQSAAGRGGGAAGGLQAGGTSSGGGQGGTGAGAAGGAGAGAGTGGSSPCPPQPVPPPKTEELCYAPSSIAPSTLAFCGALPGSIRVVCESGEVVDATSFPATSPCKGGGNLQKNCPSGLTATSASPWADPCPGPSNTGGAGGIGSGGSGAGAAGAAAGGAAAAGSGGGAGATGGGAGGGGGAAAVSVCGGGATGQDFDPTPFLRCIGVNVPSSSVGPGTSSPSMVRIGPATASEEGGATKCCHTATTEYFGQICGRPLFRDVTPIVASLVRGAVSSWAG